MKLGALITVYNEAMFIGCCLNSIKDHVDVISLVEGAYQETIKLGKPARSHDGTIEKIAQFMDESNEIDIIYQAANEESDAQQRNVALEALKSKGCDFALIVDGDEVYKPFQFKMIKRGMSLAISTNIDAYYFSCLTFVNDFRHYTPQTFPRLFRLYPDTTFTNDNYVRSNGKEWPKLNVGHLDVKYYHYGFMKGSDRFLVKKRWWESRFGKPFHYDWELDEAGKIAPDNHTIYEYNGQHPAEILDRFPEAQ